ncbi:MAG TPA: XRE family transcriptional regulator [Kiritimatiellia bacterium]|nr:XRE family transcriptional regulator [Kiritimatiellia bacterium]
MVGERIRLARKEAKLTQEAVAEKMGFKDRQILSNVESGTRKVSADELIRFMQLLGKDLNYFTDPYLITEEHAFSWRADHASDAIDRYEAKARSLVSAYRRFCELAGKAFNPLPHRLALTKKSSYEEAALAGEMVADRLKLGPTPAKRLFECMRQQLEIPVFFVNSPELVSGAACRFGAFTTVLINRNEPEWRRNFDLAHELFHVLTWDTMPPERIDYRSDAGPGRSREERLADNFAAGLLMPRESVEKSWKRHAELEIHARIMAVAREFQVSGKAAKIRLQNLGLITEGDRVDIHEDQLTRPLDDVDNGPKPKSYSDELAKSVFIVLEKGLVSRRKVAELLDCTVEDIERLLAEYGMAMPY